ncbi:MAG TPA: DUF6519 domain-containing protein [Candidatus Eisenbacteria bacterium]|nr:DUF6519 domain-containing protein [Candidatus Eisenbacteria bacterium]
MQGDFSRDTFDPTRRFSRVLRQQGRVELEADVNEQTSILLHYLRTLAADLMPMGAGSQEDAFDVNFAGGKLTFMGGHYYVGGILCEAPLGENTYEDQPDAWFMSDEDKAIDTDDPLLVYLDAWERHVDVNQDDRIREVALGGPDTSSRAKVVWQVKTIPVPQAVPPTKDSVIAQWGDDLLPLLRPAKGRLIVKTGGSVPTQEECEVSPLARYRGVENQLYRVEIHRSGRGSRDAKDGNPKVIGEATFKWSRDNGAITFAVRDAPSAAAKHDQVTLELASLGPDTQRSLAKGHRVELLNDSLVLGGMPGPVFRVESVNVSRREVNAVLETDGMPEGFTDDPDLHPILRRWDQRSADLALSEGKWLPLEAGIEIRFELDDDTFYQTGDYWLLPARTFDGRIEWPMTSDNPPKPIPQERRGVLHHYAPLAIIPAGGGPPISLRRKVPDLIPVP